MLLIKGKIIVRFSVSCKRTTYRRQWHTWEKRHNPVMLQLILKVTGTRKKHCQIYQETQDDWHNWVEFCCSSCLFLVILP